MAQVATSKGRTADALRELILLGRFAAGARLGEAELADRLGVSRTPVREALAQLAAEGFVDLSPHRGAKVRTWTAAELEDIFDLRTSLEPRITAFAVPHAGPGDVTELARLAEEMSRIGSPGPNQDLDALVPLNREFHGALVALADNPALANALSNAVHAPVVLRNFHTYDNASLRRSLAHHLEIVDAVRAGDPEWAQAVMTAHIRNARTAMVRAAAQQEVP